MKKLHQTQAFGIRQNMMNPDSFTKSIPLTSLFKDIEESQELFKKNKNLAHWIQLITYKVIYLRGVERGLSEIPKDCKAAMMFENADLYLCGLLHITGKATAFMSEIKTYLLPCERRYRKPMNWPV